MWNRPQPDGTDSILTADDVDHSRIRRLLSHAFSEKALREQEPLIVSYVELFTKRLLDQISQSSNGTTTIDIVNWFNFTTFDIIGDLGLGESFRCLEESRYHPWISMLFMYFKAIAMALSCRLLPGVEYLVDWIMPKAVKQRRIDHFDIVKAKVHRRVEQENFKKSKRDFMTAILRYNDEKGMSLPEIVSTFNILVIAGSETTATALSGITNYLLKNPDDLDQLLEEIRNSFKSQSDITLEGVSKLPYLTAVIEEGLRLCPPVPLGSLRVVPAGGANVCGEWLPGFVSSSQSTTSP